MTRSLSTRAFLTIVIVAFAILTTVPIVLYWMQRPEGYAYTGFTYESVGDNFVYLNFIEQAKEGAFFFSIPFSPVPHDPAFFHPLFLLMGWTARILWLAPIVAFHLFRIVFMGCFLVLLFRFLRRFESERMARLLLLGIATVGALYLENREASTFLSLLASPLNIASLCMVLGFFWAAFKTHVDRPSPVRTALLVALPVAQTTVQPYAIFLYGLLPLAWVFVESFFRRRSFPRAVAVFLPVLIGLALSGGYLALLANADPAITEWARMGIFQKWTLELFSLYVAVVLPFALIALVAYRHRIVHDEWFRFMVVWLFVCFAVVLSPYPYQNRLHVFLNVPLAYFAVHGMVFLWDRFAGKTRLRVALLFFIALSFTDNVHHMVMNYHPLYPEPQKIWPKLFRYLSPDDQAAFAWIRKETPPTAVFLHSNAWDTLFAARSHRHSFVTICSRRFFETHQEVLDIYTGRASLEQLSDFVRSNNITYVVMSDHDRLAAPWKAWQFRDPTIAERYPGQFAPEQYPFLERVFEHGTFAIYQVKQ